MPACGAFDGEVVAFADGVPHFPLVCERLLHGDRSIALTFVLFDVLEVDGEPVMYLPELPQTGWEQVLGISPLEGAFGGTQSEEAARAAGKAFKREGHRFTRWVLHCPRRALVNHKQHEVEGVSKPVRRPTHWAERVVRAYILAAVLHRVLLSLGRRA